MYVLSEEIHELIKREYHHGIKKIYQEFNFTMTKTLA